MRWDRLPIWLLGAFILYVPNWPFLISERAVSLPWSALVIWPLGLILLTYWWSRGRRRWYSWPLAPPAVAFFLYISLMSLRALDPEIAFYEWLVWPAGLLLAWLVQQAAVSEEDVLTLLRVFAASGVLAALIAFLQWVALAPEHEGYFRAYGFLANPNTLSGFLILTLPVATALMFEAKPLFWWIFATVISLGEALTYTRGGWYAVILALLGLGWLRDRRIWALVAVYVVLIGTFLPGAGERAASVADGEAIKAREGRIELWSVAGLLFLDEPVFGVGGGNYIPLRQEVLEARPELKRPGTPQEMEPHNSFLKTLAELGLVGLGLLLWLLLAGWRMGWSVYRRVADEEDEAKAAGMRSGPARAGTRTSLHPVSPSWGTLVAGILAGLFAFLLQANTNSLLHMPRLALAFWFLAGLLARLWNLKVEVSAPQVGENGQAV